MKLVLLIFRTWVDRHFLPCWMQNRTPDAQHPYRRRFTRQHQLKRNIVKGIWIGAALLILLNPDLHVLLAVTLPTTLLSFAILDETR